MDRKEITDLIQHVEVAMAHYRECAEAEQLARSKETAAINELNAAQRALDKALENWRKTAPRESDWNRPMGQSVVR